MKLITRLFGCVVAGIVSGWTAMAQITVPSDGSDGALVITTNTVIDLSQAVTGAWNTPNTQNPGNGVYDPGQWAVVYKYSSVTVLSNATVTFNNHPSRAPVVWLVSGNVDIEGTVSVNGEDQLPPPLLADGGPGGFRGGVGWLGGGVTSATGFGPGAYLLADDNGGPDYNWGPAWGGNYGETTSGAGSPAYGNPSLIPLIGGSGGAGGNNSQGSLGGGAGGGAMLIACAGSLTINGTVQANGGAACMDCDFSLAGSGGGIRIVANTLLGNGSVTAIGGNTGSGYYTAVDGYGRIRIERVTDNSGLQIAPDPSVLPLTNGVAPLIWMPSTGPAVTIETIGSLGAPSDPRASFGAFGADLTLPPLTSATVTVLTTNVEPQSVVTVRVNPRTSGAYVDTVASVTQTLSQTPLVLRWTASVPVNNGYSAVQVHVVRP